MATAFLKEPYDRDLYDRVTVIHELHNVAMTLAMQIGHRYEGDAAQKLLLAHFDFDLRLRVADIFAYEATLYFHNAMRCIRERLEEGPVVADTVVEVLQFAVHLTDFVLVGDDRLDADPVD